MIVHILSPSKITKENSLISLSSLKSIWGKHTSLASCFPSIKTCEKTPPARSRSGELGWRGKRRGPAAHRAPSQLEPRPNAAVNCSFSCSNKNGKYAVFLSLIPIFKNWLNPFNSSTDLQSEGSRQWRVIQESSSRFIQRQQYVDA